MPEDIDAKVSVRICNHMNQDHPASILAMAVSLWPKAERARMDKISLGACTITAVAGNAGGAGRKQLSWTFDPPLADAAEARTRLVEVHGRVTRVHFEQPVSAVVLFMVAFVFTAAFAPIAVMDPVRELANVVFPAPNCLRVLGYILLISHGIEALYAGALARKLKLSFSAGAGWVLGTVVCGVGALEPLKRLAGAKALAGSYDKSD
mmetsp:Transcript_15782/g.48890  ORF Transcript_15782/g.48890 Transcript_15782/m.48890 type:complete len:207 (-) Transcript_15782:53-673(-)